MEITISKTVQITQYEPLTVTVTDSAPVETNKQYEELKTKVSACVQDILVAEIQRYNELKRVNH